MRRLVALCKVVALAALALCTTAAQGPEWRLARSEHFEVYAQSGAERAQAVLAWFEQLRAFFERQGEWKRLLCIP